MRAVAPLNRSTRPLRRRHWTSSRSVSVDAGSAYDTATVIFIHVDRSTDTEVIVAACGAAAAAAGMTASAAAAPHTRRTHRRARCLTVPPSVPFATLIDDTSLRGHTVPREEIEHRRGCIQLARGQVPEQPAPPAARPLVLPADYRIEHHNRAIGAIGVELADHVAALVPLDRRRTPVVMRPKRHGFRRGQVGHRRPWDPLAVIVVRNHII